MLDQISVVIITKNAEETLRDTLVSTQNFSEVVVYDNGSEDATLEILKEFPNVSLHQGKFMGFGPTKSHAVGLAKHDWVLSLDADEVVSAPLNSFIRDWIPENTNVVGVVRRDNYMMGQLVDKGGWGSDWLVRVFHRGTHQFNDNAVHESVPLHSGSLEQKIACPIEHNAVQHLGQFLVKIDRYTEIRRQTMTKTYHPAFIVLRSLFTFFKSYIIKRGAACGWRGLVIAWNEANGVFYKYMKIYADQNGGKRS
jgi:glycosyltransferase involved in cell wall biosynthesis